jgi:hypothetical protein
MTLDHPGFVPKGPFLRFAGRLRDGGWMPAVGWEVEEPTTLVDGYPGARLELLDERSNVMTTALASIEEDECRAIGDPTNARVVGYLPFREGGAFIRMTLDGRLVTEEPLSPQPPGISWDQARVEGDRLLLKWRSSHVKPVTHFVALVQGNHSVPLVVDSGETRSEIELELIPMQGECQAIVLATDGRRSAEATSQRLVLPAKPPAVVIQSPSSERELFERNAISLHGYAISPEGVHLDDRHLVWRVDGTEVARGDGLAWVQGLPAGEHQIQLTWSDHASAARGIVVVAEPEAHKGWSDDWARASALDEGFDHDLGGSIGAT